jgi:hypothetical protein
MTMKALGIVVLLITASHWLVEATGYIDPPRHYTQLGPR